MSTEEQKTIDTLMELKQLLQTENEHLYQQYNHLMIRNQKLLTRIDDQQQLNDKLQERIAHLERIIDSLRMRNDAMPQFSANQQNFSDMVKHQIVPMVQGVQSHISVQAPVNPVVDLKQLVARWGTLAGEFVKNKPTKTRQMQILSLLYEYQKMSGMKLFIACGITGVSGTRYISALKHFGLIAFSGFKKDGYYFITDKGKELVEGN